MENDQEKPHYGSDEVYEFRGKKISGHRANSILRSLKEVERECPNSTAEDIARLEEIMVHFHKVFEESLIEYQEEVNNNPEMKAERDAWLDG